MPLVVNWASTWANQTSGSAGQKGGSFILVAAMVGVAVAVVIDSSSLIISRVAYSLRQGRQCCLPQLYVQWQ